MAYGFFAGNFSSTLDTAAYKTAGIYAFNYFNAAEGVTSYQALSNIQLELDTPGVTNIPNSSQDNKEANGQKTGCGLIRNGNSLAETAANGFMGAINSGTGDTENPFYYIGMLNFEIFNAASSPPTLNDAGGAQNYARNRQMTTAGNVINADSTTYTVCVAAGPKQGESVNANTGARATYRAANSALATLLAKLNYYKPSATAFGLYVTGGMTDEQAAAVWLANGYGILKGGGALAFASVPD